MVRMGDRYRAGRAVQPACPPLRGPTTQRGGGPDLLGENIAPEVAGGTAAKAGTVFINSPFNDHEAGNKSNDAPQGRAAFLLFSLALEGAQQYPVDDLQALSGTQPPGHARDSDDVDPR